MQTIMDIDKYTLDVAKYQKQVNRTKKKSMITNENDVKKQILEFNRSPVFDLVTIPEDLRDDSDLIESDGNLKDIRNFYN